MKEAFTKAEYANMHGTLTIFTGIFASLIILFSNNILRKFSWKVAAVITPICCLTVGGAFMLLVLYKQFISATIFGVSSTVVAVWCGIFYDALAKGFKYSLFDATKGMTYRPLDEEERNKGQAAVEIIGGRAGKASASAVQQILLSFPMTLQTTTGSVSGILAHSPVLVVSFFATVVLWIFSVFKLSDKYEKKIKEKNLK
jgi:AAA family ATP:ADP antiporter